VLVTYPAQRFQKTWLRRNTVHIARDWLHDNAGNLIANFIKTRLDPFRIVKRQRNSVFS
jgi:hypothetical protein